jgi:hypothetical protein
VRLLEIAIACAVALSALPLRAQDTPETMPIADLHFHAEENKKPDFFEPIFARAGVRWFGLGERFGGPAVLRSYKKHFGDRYIAFGGQSSMNDIFWSSAREMENPDNPQFRKLYEYLESGLKDGSLAGIGELFVNNLNSNPNGRMKRRMNIGGPVLTSLVELAAKYNAFVAFHMEGDEETVAKFEALAAAHRKTRIILNHCGVQMTPGTLDRLFTAHPNVFCDISIRYPPEFPMNGVYGRIFSTSSMMPGWQAVMTKHADRFLIGTDTTGSESAYTSSIKNVRSVLLPSLPIEAARKIAYGNAVALFNLK